MPNTIDYERISNFFWRVMIVIMAEEEIIASSYSGDWLARVVSSKHFHRVAARLRKAIILVSEEGRAIMDSRIWEQLSLDLVEKVIASLPFPILFRGRAVCKHWTTFIFSQKFQAIRANGISWADLSPQASHLLLFLSTGNALVCTAYCPDLNRWVCMPAISCLPTQAKDVVASDGGLLCFRDRSDETGPTGLFVCNPITQECRQLPDMLIFSTEPATQGGYVWIFTQLIVDRSTSTYALVVGLYDHRMRAYLEVYSSTTNTWTTDSSLPLHNLGVFFNPQNGAVCNNALYCVVTERVDPEEEAASQEAAPRAASHLFSLFPAEPLYVRYVVSTDLLGNWMKLRQFGTQERPLHMTNLHVVQCVGSLFMVVGEWINYAGSELEIAIYLLHDSGGAMAGEKVEVERLSDVRVAEGWQPGYQVRSYTCVGQGESVCLVDLTSFLVLAYHVKQQVWKWLPQCPFTGVKHFHLSSLTNVHRGQARPKPRGCLLSNVSFQPSHCSLPLL